MRKLLFFLLILLSACQRSSTLPSTDSSSSFENLSLSQKIAKAHLILEAQVLKTEAWPAREDWQISTLKPLKLLKGKTSREIRVFEPHLFPKEPSLFQKSETVLVFLKEIPPYTAWQPLIKSGVREEVIGGNLGIIRGEKEIEIYSQFIAGVLAQKNSQEFYENLLSQNLPPGFLKALTEDYFHLFPAVSLSETALHFWEKRLQSSQFPDAAKIMAVQELSTVHTPAMNQVLQNLFCFSPTEMCLRVAETLESQKIALPFLQYTQAIQEGSEDLRVGLLSILARHQRAEVLPLFEKYLKLEKDEKPASSLVEALGDLGPGAQDLILAYAQDPRYQVRLAAIISLGRVKSEKAIPILEKCLTAKDPLLIMMAAESLKQIGSQKALGVLEKYYHKDPHGYWEPSGPEHFLPPR